MESTNTIVTKPKRVYKRKADEVKPVEIKPVEIKQVEVKSIEIKPSEVKVEESKPTFTDVIKTNTETNTKKKKRNIDPNKMTYLKAFSIWKQKTGYSGLSPKKNTDEYNQVMAILNEHKNK